MMNKGHSIKTGRMLTPLLVALVLAGCAAPELKAPAIDIPAAFKESSAPAGEMGTAPADWKAAQPADTQARGEWWKAFNDRSLDSLIGEATAANANVAAATARVRQARALAGIAEADRVPAVGAQFGPQRQRYSDVFQGLPQGTPIAPVTQWQAKLTASYEVDLFGRVANNVNAARADAEASAATLRSVLLSVQADVAQTYLRLRAADAELVLLKETTRLREENVRINQRRFDLGDIGEFDLSRAKTEFSTTQAEAIGLQRQRSILEHALAVLLGRTPAAFSEAANPLMNDQILPRIPAGMPSALLERRPDIAAAERSMVAANSRIGVARSAMFPALSITGNGGSESQSLSDLFLWSGRAWLVSGLLSMPVIDGGRSRSNVTRSEAALEESVANYRQSVLSAFAEVEDNLAGLRILSGQARSIDDAVVSAQRNAELADKLYSAGRASYLDLLDAQRNLVSTQRTAVQLRGDRAVTTVALVRALGGGW